MTRTNLLRDLVRQSGWSQRRCADALGVNERTFRYWCSGRYEPQVMVIYAMKYLICQQHKQRVKDLMERIAAQPEDLTPDPITDDMVPPCP